ncbi:ubiquinone biosynthesis O-methyltransferase, mitochondrial-like [Penaeus indicus]|uniref:ubiquinone biosynthesis O-methyltransferase, mitochondrial-like n=1 Tax=Penaeus indicus TaxID=29960 RepID=UPI00300DA921
MLGRITSCLATRSLQRILISRTPACAERLQWSSIPREVSTSSSSFHQHEQSIQDENTDFTSRNGKETTYVEEEVAKFRLMASSWWDPHGDCKPLHSLNKLRVSMICDGLIQSGIAKPEYVEGPTPLKGLKILDVGCGGGILCEPLARLGASVVGLDAAEENITVAKLHAEQDPKVHRNVEYLYGTIEEHAETIDEIYDAVIASEVLEHVESTDLFLSTCAQTIKPGGSFFITTINKTPFSWVGGIAIAEYVLHLLPPGTHDWNKFIPRQELLFVLEKYGFVTRLVHGMGYNPLTNNWFWLSDTSINYAVHCVKEK